MLSICFIMIPPFFSQQTALSNIFLLKLYLLLNLSTWIYLSLTSGQMVKQILDKSTNERSVKELELLMNLTRNNKFFSNYYEEGYPQVHKQCCRRMKYEEYDAHKKLFNQGNLRHRILVCDFQILYIYKLPPYLSQAIIQINSTSF